MITRTVTNIRNGGNNPIAGFAHAVTLILLIFFLAPLASDERVLGKIDKAGIFQALGSQPYHADFSGALGRYAEIDQTQGWRGVARE